MALSVGIMGAGSVGCWIGGRLASVDGVEVTLLGRPALREAVLARGLELSDLGERAYPAVRPRFECDPAALRDAAVVLCTVKSRQTVEIARQLAPLLQPQTLLISLQNGVRNADQLRAELPLEIVLAGIVGFNVLSRGGAAFRRATSGPLVIEASADPRAEALRAALETAGFEVQMAREIRGLQWSKLVTNLNNAISALSGVTTPELLASPGYRRALGLVVTEAIRALKAGGVQTERLGPIPIGLFPLAMRLPTWLLQLLTRAQLEIDPEARSSMWEDLEKRRPTEIEELNGEIVRLAKAHGLEAPVNQRLVELIHRAEAAAQGSPRLSPTALLAELERGTD